MTTDTWVVEVKGPHGVKQVEIPDSQVQLMNPDAHDGRGEYATAAWLAYTDLWMKLGEPNDSF